jgi:hypothetical protein
VDAKRVRKTLQQRGKSISHRKPRLRLFALVSDARLSRENFTIKI